jgi:hypothetical protein
MSTAANRLVDLYYRPLPSAPAWISGGVLMKGGIMLMGGLAKIGKTMLGLDLAHNLGTGGTLWGTDYQVLSPAPVLYIDKELGEYGFHERVKKRYETLGTPPPGNLYYLSRPRDFYLDTHSGIDRLADEVTATGAKIVFLDPISRCMMGDENSNTDVNRLFVNLDRILADFPDLSFVLTHHFGKPPRGADADDYDPFSPYNFRGASKWFDAPDTLVTFQRQPAGGPTEWWRLRTGWQFRHAPEPEENLVLAVTDGGLIQRICADAPHPERIARSLKPAGGGARWRR